ncbi:PREDICTED: ylmG homolog protein 1-2, chloroplastic-like [Tarenaya hassleriana]|uniref:ylmG homolog protein 1-2, chloroplastic-like n=1 Tax=Tarenaya hassleriana TaxID=28532 RepID=UPI00053C4E3D|nr:PREDICTED: ylmG homolog protein 1-2, chloroplastic-like [Tarenaya hassleriana]XP_010527282.1 PREDICTED: ylmG homolog protein 1-2, chloroplastic-like [Tarenaya hassleriana]
MASITNSLSLRGPIFLDNRFLYSGSLPSHRNLTFCHMPKPYLSLSVRNPSIVASAASSSSPTASSRCSQSRIRFPLSDSTRSITTLALVASIVVKSLAHKLSLAIVNLGPQIQESLHYSLRTVGPVFFASLRDRPSGYLNTPLTVVAAGLSKWLDIYSGVLMVRVLLSWFPNIPWDRQPLSAIRDLCDPYLNLFRNIIPPVFDTLDVSPLLAFAVLGTLGSILNNSRGY